MRRRTLLAAAAAAVAGTAGCLTSASGAPGDDPPTTTDDPTATPTRDDPTATPDDPSTTPDDPTATPTPGPNAGPDSGCPSFVADADRTVCYHSNRASSDVYLAPETREFVEYESSDEVATLSLTLHNDGDRAFGLNPHDWAIERWTEQGWRHVAPQEHVEPWYEVAPGETYEWVLSTETHSGPTSENSMAVVADLVSGENYAFRVRGRYAGERVECVARFEYLRAVPGLDPR